MSKFTEVDAVITHRLYHESDIGHVIGFVLALLIGAAALRTGVPTQSVYTWLALISLTYLARTILTLTYKHKNSANKYWLNRLRFGVIITGFAWSTVIYLLLNPSSYVNQSMILLTLAGLSAAFTMTYAIDLICVFGFIFPIGLSLIVRYYIEGTITSNVMVMMLFLFFTLIIASAKKSNRIMFENIRLAASAKVSQTKERAHSQVMEMLAKKEPLESVLHTIVMGVEEQNPKMLCSILLLDDLGKNLLHGAAPSLPSFYNDAIHGTAIEIGVGSCGTASFTGERVIVEDIQTHPYWSNYKELAAKANLAACWSEPIKDSTGKVLGSFAIYHREPTSPTDDEIQTILHTAYLAGIAIELSRSNHEQQLASMLYQSSNESMMITDANNLIIAVNPAFTIDTGYSAEEVIGKDPKILNSGKQDNTFYQNLWHQVNKTGKWEGEIWNRRKNGELYAEWIRINTITDSSGAVINYVSLATDVTKKKESEDIIWKQANFDSLTGLPNRRMFHDRFQQEIKKSNRADLPLALLFIDLDQFKEVNDTLGHHVGDILLKETAKRLTSCVRETDTIGHENTVARLGGDEFTIILSELKDINCIERIAERILSKIAEPYQLNEEVVYISASIGITMYPVDSTDIDTLIKNADQAMYAAKHQGRNQFSYFTESMQISVQTRMRLTNDLRSALEKNQFQLRYQPIVDLVTGEINKAEALIRWIHPSIGIISPAEFIPVAEDTGLIVDIGDWVFYEAANQVKNWRKSINPNFQISINKSPLQFLCSPNSRKNSTHVSWIDYLNNLKLPGQSIAVEITERLLLDNSGSTHSQLLEFRDAGIQVSLDDFGTGYSSLAYLKKFDIDYIKIDQSFVQNLGLDSDDMALCEAIIVMAHKLNLKVIAEGVETQQQLDLLKAAGCDYGQGYYFSEPLSAKDFSKLENFKR